MKPKAVTAHTRVFALLGDPISQSLSPLIQNAAIRTAQLDAVYVALRCRTDDVRGLVHGLARAGGGGNVTKPHKQAAAAALERATPNVQLTGACNTFWLEDDAVVGDNTDVDGFVAALHTHFSTAAGQRVLLLGGGGAARAVALALASERCERIDLLARSSERLDQIRAVVAGCGTEVQPVRLPLRTAYDLAINATSLGMEPADPLPLEPADLERVAGVLDLVYSPASTPLVRAARAAGIPAYDGTEMLVRQAAAAFKRWWRIEPPIEAMRGALQHASP